MEIEIDRKEVEKQLKESEIIINKIKIEKPATEKLQDLCEWFDSYPVS